ncbi:thiamine phosphate synthase [Candidatus Peribacteria bacterium]|nr:thiamine phosphate synthase [Candidatus Peribacteria bacterium]
MWTTPTKPDRLAIGFEYLSQVSELEIPFVAIGGINSDNISEILPYKPDMIGIVRGYESIPFLKQLFGDC